MEDERKDASDEFVDADLDAAEPLRSAELRLLDALLQEIHAPDAAAVEARVQKALAAIAAAELRPAAARPETAPPDTAPVAAAADSAASPDSRRRWLDWAPAAIAAALLISTGWWAFAPRGSAFAAAEKAYDASLESVDREYQVTIVRNGPLALLAPQEATLYVRGASRFALRHPGAVPGDFWFGSDGKQSWFVPVVGPALVSDDPHWLRQRAEQEKVALPFLQVSSILQRLGDRYELKTLPSETLAGQGEIPWQRIRGTRRAAARAAGEAAAALVADAAAPAARRGAPQRLPQTVDLWIHPHSGVAGKVVVTWEPELLKPSLRRIELQLASERRQPDDWYDYASHCRTPRAVQHVE
jgi:hypothetical protein